MDRAEHSEIIYEEGEAGMKKFIKGLAVAAVIMIVLGIGLFVGGAAAMGGMHAARAALTGYEFYFNEDGVHLTLEDHGVRNSHHWEYHK